MPQVPVRLLCLFVAVIAVLSAGGVGGALPASPSVSASASSISAPTKAPSRPPVAAPGLSAGGPHAASPTASAVTSRSAPAAAPAPKQAVATSAAATPSTGPFRVSGNQILDAQSRPFVVHGVDRPSLEWNCHGQALNGAEGILRSDFQLMAAWHANTVRIPLNQDFWLSSMGTPVAPHWVCPSYQRSVLQAVSDAEAAGLVVILDLHWSDEGNALNPNVGQKCMADANSLVFWRSVADTYRTHPSVMFELYNEPMGVPWSVWQNGGMAHCATDGVTYPVVGMQTLITAVRGRGADNVVLAGGLKMAYDLQSVPAYPLTGGNIAYATHPYEGYVGDSPAGWTASFGYLAAYAPVIATEFGNTGCTTNAYSTDIIAYMNAHAIGFTEWLWFPGQCQSLVDASGGCHLAGCILKTQLQAIASGSAQTMTMRSLPLPPMAAGGAVIRNDFESTGTQGWITTWAGSHLALAPSTVAHTGATSLGISVTTPGANAALEQRTGLTGVGPGSVVTYWLYAPPGFDDTVTPFARDSRGTPHFFDTVYLQPGWNRINWQVPAMQGIFSLGLEVEASSAWVGSLALDSVSW